MVSTLAVSTLATSYGSALYHDMLATVEQGRLPVVVPVTPGVVYLQSFKLTEPCVLLDDIATEREKALMVVVCYVHQEVRKNGS